MSWKMVNYQNKYSRANRKPSHIDNRKIFISRKILKGGLEIAFYHYNNFIYPIQQTPGNLLIKCKIVNDYAKAQSLYQQRFWYYDARKVSENGQLLCTFGQWASPPFLLSQREEAVLDTFNRHLNFQFNILFLINTYQRFYFFHTIFMKQGLLLLFNNTLKPYLF